MSKSKKRMSVCLCALIFSTFFGSSFRIFNAGGTAIYLFRLIFLLFMAMHVVYESRHKNMTKRFSVMNKYKNPLTLFIIFDLATVLLTPNINEWADGQITFVINIAIIYFIYYYTDDRRDIDNYIKAYMLGVCMTMLVSIYEYCTGVHIISNNYIYSRERTEWAITELSKYPTAFLYNPNNIGVAMLIGAAYGLMFLADGIRMSKLKYTVYFRILRSQFRLRKYYIEASAIFASLLIFIVASVIPPTIITLHFIWVIFGFAIAMEKVYCIEYE